MAKPNYEKPTSQLDLEARQKSDYEPAAVLVKGTDAEPSDNGYVGVDPIYQTFANDTEQPLLAEKGAEAKVEDRYYADDVDTEAGATPTGEPEAEEKAEESKTSQTTGSGSTQSTTPSTPSTPPSS
jgi:hypothetical protein